MSQNCHPRIGVGVFVLQSLSTSNPRFIMGQRMGSHGAGRWALPGGHLEFGESFEECGAREILEETGLQVKNLRYLTATNDVMESENKHYVTIFMTCERVDNGAEPTVLEPDKCLTWEWIGWEEMKEYATRSPHARLISGGEDSERQLFSPLIALLQQRPGVVPGFA